MYILIPSTPSETSVRRCAPSKENKKIPKKNPTRSEVLAPGILLPGPWSIVRTRVSAFFNHRRCEPCLAVKKGCLSASAALILLSGLSARQDSRSSMKWLRSRVSVEFSPSDAAISRVRRSRAGFIIERVLTVVYRKTSC